MDSNDIFETACTAGAIGFVYWVFAANLERGAGFMGGYCYDSTMSPTTLAFWAAVAAAASFQLGRQMHARSK